jgi:hypothetical protein
MFIFVPSLMMTSPPFWPGLQGPIRVETIVISGGALGGDRIVIVILESKSPLTSARDVLVTPGRSSHVVSDVQEPFGLRVICACWHLRLFDTSALKIDVRASDAASTQD